MEAGMSDEARELLNNPRTRYNLVGAYLERTARERRGEPVEPKKQSTRGAMVHVLRILSTQASDLAQYCEDRDHGKNMRRDQQIEKMLGRIKRNLATVELVNEIAVKEEDKE